MPLSEIKPGDIVVWTWWRDDFKEDFEYCKSIGAYTIVGLAALETNKIFADLYIGSFHELSDVKFDAEKALIVTVGAAGAKYFKNGSEYLVRTGANEVVDTTGAGDALLAGVIVGLPRNLKIQDSLHIGVNWAAMTIASESSLPASWSQNYIELAS